MLRRALGKTLLKVVAPICLTLGLSGQVAAQSAGCSAVNGGIFNQTAVNGGDGMLITQTLQFAAGETITVTYTNSRNILFDIFGLATVLSGQTGNGVASYTFALAVLATIEADIRAQLALDAVMTVTCSFPAPPPTPPTTPPTPPTTPTTPTAPVPDPVSEDLVGSFTDSIDSGRPSTLPGDLPGRFNPPQTQVQQSPSTDQVETARLNRDTALQDFIAAEASIEDAARRNWGVDFNSPGILLARGAYFNALRQGTVAQADRTALPTLRRALLAEIAAQREAGFTPNRNDPLFLETNVEAILSEVALLATKQFLVESSNRALEIAIANAQAQPPGSRAAVTPLSFAGSTDNRLRFSTQGTRLGDSDTWLWSEGQVAFINGAQARDGYIGSFRLGVVTAASSTMDIGFFGTYLNAEVKQTGINSTLNSEGFGFGAYLKNDLGKDMVGGVSVFYELTSNDANANGTTASFDRTYLEVNGEISRNYFVEGWSIVPSASVGFVHTNRDGYTDSAANTFAASSETYGRSILGLSVSRTVGSPVAGISHMDLTGNARVGINLEDRPNRALSNGSIFENSAVTGNVNAGATLHFNGGSVLDLRLGTSGIGGDSKAVYGSFGYRLNF